MASNNLYALNSGSSGYFSVTPIPLTSEWSFEALVKFPIPTNGCQTLVRGTNDHQIIFYPNLGVFDNATSTGMHSCDYPLSSISAGWHRITTIGKSGSQKFYVDGVYVGTSNFQSKSDIATIGNYAGGSQPIGYFDDVRLFNYARTDSEILRDWNKYLNNGTTGLVACWRCDEGSGTVVHDATGNGHDGTFVSNITWANTDFNLMRGKMLFKENDIFKAYNTITNTWEDIGVIATYSDYCNKGVEDVPPISEILKLNKPKLCLFEEDTTYNPKSKITAIPMSQVIKMKNDINLSNVDKINSFTSTLTETGNGVVKIAISFNKGLSYSSFNGTDWVNINIDDKTEFKSNGMTKTVFNAISSSYLELLRNKSSNLRLAYYLEISQISDVSTIDNLAINCNLNGTWNKPPNYNSVDWCYKSNTLLEVKINESGTWKINYPQ